MSFVFASADLESCFRAARKKIDGEVSVVHHRDEEVALFVDETAYLLKVGHTHPVEFLLEDGVCDAGQEKFVLSDASEVEEVDVYLYSGTSAPGHDVILEHIESGFLHINDDVGGAD